MFVWLAAARSPAHAINNTGATRTDKRNTDTAFFISALYQQVPSELKIISSH
jgi:hypothetical protein